jgi:hypothetical protein
MERAFKPDRRDIIYQARFLDLPDTSQARFLNLLGAISWFTIRDGSSKRPPPLAVFLISELDPGSGSASDCAISRPWLGARFLEFLLYRAPVPHGKCPPAAHETLLLCVVIGSELGLILVQAKPVFRADDAMERGRWSSCAGDVAVSTANDYTHLAMEATGTY